MARLNETIWCDGCGVEIYWAPVIVGRLDHCCEDCAQGLPCDCAQRWELEEERRPGQSDIPGYLDMP